MSVAFFIPRSRAIASNSWSVSGSNRTCTLAERPRVADTLTVSVSALKLVMLWVSQKLASSSFDGTVKRCGYCFARYRWKKVGETHMSSPNRRLYWNETSLQAASIETQLEFVRESCMYFLSPRLLTVSRFSPSSIPSSTFKRIGVGAASSRSGNRSAQRESWFAPCRPVPQRWRWDRYQPTGN